MEGKARVLESRQMEKVDGLRILKGEENNLVVKSRRMQAHDNLTKVYN